MAGAKAGGLGDAAAFSFYPTKNLSAAGDAGMVTTNSDEIAERVKMLRQHGMRRRYYHDEVGWNARMDGFQGAILSVKLKYIDGWNHARRTLAERYHALFRAAGLAEAGPYPKPTELSFHKRFGAPATSGISMSSAQFAETNFASFYRKERLVRRFITLSRCTCRMLLKSLGYSEGSFPEAERAAREVLALPIFPELREDEQQTVVAAIAEFLS